MWQLFFALLFALPPAQAPRDISTATSATPTGHPILALGWPAPDFSLPGVDGNTHSLAEYASAPILVIVFTCNHCPIAQMYEQRIQQLETDYRDRGVAVVAIEPNDPNALRIDELDSSDISDSLDEMKIRFEYKHLHYPYLYDGETQSVTRAYGPQATPHVFIFDKDRKLRYEGRMDNSYRKEMVNAQDARNAIDALLAGREVAVKHTGVFGCSTKWKEKFASSAEALRKIAEQPVKLDLATAEDLKRLRQNPGKHMALISFWATWCGSCIDEFADFQDTFQMYKVRDLELITVSANMPDEKNGVLRMLEKKHATSRNLLFASNDTAALQAAFDPTWESAVPYTVLLDPNGKILYKNLGSVDILELRRTILANLPSDYIGFNEYWRTSSTQSGSSKSDGR
ncbi:MAG TPA: redoxin family protein [Opitutaceae bacterium]|nr:redoxin family protein [Opitutaceae bacterium]